MHVAIIRMEISHHRGKQGESASMVTPLDDPEVTRFHTSILNYTEGACTVIINTCKVVILPSKAGTANRGRAQTCESPSTKSKHLS